jgi:predicted DNA-binding transcriptional regulator YafY
MREDKMSHSTARALAVLELLQTHGTMRGEDLAARLEVDVRTIRRYVMILRDRGMPVEMERGRYGGYRLRPGFKLPLALTGREALAVACGLLSVSQQRQAPAGGDSERALTKITRSLPPQTRDLIQHLEEAVTFVFPTLPGSAPTAGEHLETLVHAVRSHRRLRLTYAAWTGDVTERRVDPYQAVYRFGRWYLVGYCHLRDAQRVFRVDHIRDAGMLSETFDPPRHVDALAAVEQAIAQIPWRWEYTVRLDLPLDEARRRVPPTIAELQQQGQGALMHGFAEDLAWLAYLLAGLGCRLAVLHPPELRACLLALAEHVKVIAASPE